MVLTTLPQNVFEDLSSFIFEKYSNKLPNSLIIAQAFILKYPHHGNEYGLSVINTVIEEGINKGFFK